MLSENPSNPRPLEPISRCRTSDGGSVSPVGLLCHGFDQRDMSRCSPDSAIERSAESPGVMNMELARFQREGVSEFLSWIGMEAELVQWAGSAFGR